MGKDLPNTFEELSSHIEKYAPERTYYFNLYVWGIYVSRHYGLLSGEENLFMQKIREYFFKKH